MAASAAVGPMLPHQHYNSISKVMKFGIRCSYYLFCIFSAGINISSCGADGSAAGRRVVGIRIPGHEGKDADGGVKVAA